MDVSSIASLATSTVAAKANSAVGIAVLKKAIDLQASTAASLIQALPSQSANPNVGGNVNTIA
jgi:hypothetical protein